MPRSRSEAVPLLPRPTVSLLAALLAVAGLPTRIDPRAFEAELSWEPSAPVNDELLFGLYARRSCGSDRFEYRALANVTGPPPLALAATIAFEERETALILFVETPRQFPPPFEGWVNVDQSFTVTGSITRCAARGVTLTPSRTSVRSRSRSSR